MPWRLGLTPCIPFSLHKLKTLLGLAKFRSGPGLRGSRPVLRCVGLSGWRRGWWQVDQGCGRRGAHSASGAMSCEGDKVDLPEQWPVASLSEGGIVPSHEQVVTTWKLCFGPGH